jgi:SAM-dependent methyltransferase
MDDGRWTMDDDRWTTEDGRRRRRLSVEREGRVARHLGIDLREYDARIRTFIPGYDAMLDAAAGALRGKERLIVDVGIGTGALAERCLRHSPNASLLGIDLDPGMLGAAATRLGPRARLHEGSFVSADLPRCDAIVASLALHHVRTKAEKGRLYGRLRRALRPGGRLVTADCCPSIDRALAAQQRDAWRTHLRRTYSASRTTAYFAAWAKEDVYVPLPTELALLTAAGFRPEVVWRSGMFAVIVATA